jgi:hypothetical protein
MSMNLDSNGAKEEDNINSIRLFTLAHQSTWYLRIELSFGAQIKDQVYRKDLRGDQ